MEYGGVRVHGLGSHDSSEWVNTDCVPVPALVRVRFECALDGITHTAWILSPSSSANCDWCRSFSGLMVCVKGKGLWEWRGRQRWTFTTCCPDYHTMAILFIFTSQKEVNNHLTIALQTFRYHVHIDRCHWLWYLITLNAIPDQRPVGQSTCWNYKQMKVSTFITIYPKCDFSHCFSLLLHSPSLIDDVNDLGQWPVRQLVTQCNWSGHCDKNLGHPHHCMIVIEKYPLYPFFEITLLQLVQRNGESWRHSPV